MNNIKKAYLRAIGTITATFVLVVGMTFAAVNTQATLTGSSLSTTSADLLLWNGNSFASTAPGFAVDSLVPGIGSQEFSISFKNTGGSPMTLGAHIPTVLKFAGFNSTSASTAMKAVKVTIKNTATGEKIDTSLYSLTLSTDVALPGPALKGGATTNPLDPASEGNYTIRFDVDATAIGTLKATVDMFDLVFSGKPVTT
ncbi:MAG: hypothetical protein JWM37_4 [Candidatus Saccharibacteria bacterium]|nr:hypothetical protein [Candidatus Saccharibacteria bacterium]